MAQGFTGTAQVKYAPEEDGPFRCDRCAYFNARACKQPDVARDPQVPKRNGKPWVDDGGCCEYWKRAESSSNILLLRIGHGDTKR